MIEPVREELAGGRPDIHTAWRAWTAEHPEVTGDFPAVWHHRQRAKGNPLRD
jgi:hypothetical protein